MDAIAKKYAKLKTRADAHYAVLKAIKQGRLVRQPCERCGATERMEAHHDDYARPLDVRWLCQPCHHLEHGAYPNPQFPYSAVATWSGDPRELAGFLAGTAQARWQTRLRTRPVWSARPHLLHAGAALR